MQAVNNSEAKRYEYLFKCKRSKFWLEVSKFKKKKSLCSNNINIDKFEEYYSKCFDSSNATHIPAHNNIKEEVDKKLEDLKNIKYNVKFTSTQIDFVIAQLNKGKAFGYDSVSAEMIIYA